ncbi:hypothetical protein [Robbsia andropogonis]|nr:hypothetical protein [Robbsia andropogonis]
MPETRQGMRDLPLTPIDEIGDAMPANAFLTDTRTGMWLAFAANA